MGQGYQRIFLLLFALFLGCSKGFESTGHSRSSLQVGEQCSSKQIPVRQAIFGVDDRTGVESSASYVGWAESVLGFVDSSRVGSGGSITPMSGKIGDYLGLCSSEKFYDEPLVATCTAALVAPNVLLTVSHCVTDITACTRHKYVFDLSYANDAKDPTKADTGSVYTCKELMYSVDNNHDLALIRLSEQVTDRPYFPMNLNGNLSTGTPLIDIGHSEGMPLRISPDGEVQGFTREFIMHSLDVFSGNSGSPVFTTDGTIVGVHAKRMFDHYTDQGSCKVRQAVQPNPSLYGRAPEQFWAQASDTRALEPVLKSSVVVLVGQVESTLREGGNMEVQGWACALARETSVEISLSNGGGTVKANEDLYMDKSEIYCQSGVAHGFKVVGDYDEDANIEVKLEGEMIRLSLNSISDGKSEQNGSNSSASSSTNQCQ